MMKKLTFLFSLFSSIVFAQNPADSLETSEMFPDPVFRQYLFNTIDYNQDQRIQWEEVWGTNKLVLKSQPVESIKGIELFSHLDTLFIEGSYQITSIDLTANHKIIDLDIHWCSSLVELKVSKEAPAIVISAHDNALTSFDASGLSQLHTLRVGAQNLTYLDIRGTQLTYLNAFENPKVTVCIDSYAQWEAIAYNDLWSCGPNPQPWCSYELACLDPITGLNDISTDNVELSYIDYDLLGNKITSQYYQGIVIRHYESGLRRKIHPGPSY